MAHYKAELAYKDIALQAIVFLGLSMVDTRGNLLRLRNRTFPSGILKPTGVAKRVNPRKKYQ